MKKIGLVVLLVIVCNGFVQSQNWFPLEVGNKWHLIDQGFFAIAPGSTLSGWIHEFRSVTDSVILNDKKYYYLSKFFNFPASIPIRFDTSSQQLLIYMNGTDNLFMDFSLNDSSIFLQINPNGTFSEAMVLSKNRTILDSLITIKGFYRITYSTSNPTHYKRGYYYFADNMGFVFQDESSPEFYGIDFWDDYSIGEYLVCIDNILFHKKHNYSADIQFYPVYFLPASNILQQQFNIMHPYSFYGYNRNDTYMDEVFIESYYSNQSDTIINNNIEINALSEIDFELNTTIDTNKYNQGYFYHYRIVAKDRGIMPTYYYKPDSDYYKLYWKDSTTSYLIENIQVTKFSLSQNYPNPFNPSTKISWQSPVGSWQTLKVYDILGNEVATLVNEYRNAGSYEVDFQSTVNSHQLANGVYFYQLRVGDYVETKKMMLLK
jgi:hypothetical protein